MVAAVQVGLWTLEKMAKGLLLPGRPQLSGWEPSWEPFGVDWCGHARTLVESGALLMRDIWNDADGRGGCLKIYGSGGWGSNPSGRASQSLAVAGFPSLLDWSMDRAPIGRLSPVDQSDQTFDRFSLLGRDHHHVCG